MDTQYIHVDPDTEEILGWYFTAFNGKEGMLPTDSENLYEVTEEVLGTYMALGLTKYTAGTNTYHTIADGIQPDLVFSHIDYSDYSIHFDVVDDGEHAARKLLQRTYREVIEHLADGEAIPAQLIADRAAAKALLAGSTRSMPTSYTPV